MEEDQPRFAAAAVRQEMDQSTRELQSTLKKLAVGVNNLNTQLEGNQPDPRESKGRRVHFEEEEPDWPNRRHHFPAEVMPPGRAPTPMPCAPRSSEVCTPERL